MNLAFISLGNIKTCYHCNYDSLHLNNKCATLFTENILSAMNKEAWPQIVKENIPSKSFSDSDDTPTKKMLSCQLKVSKLCQAWGPNLISF